MARHELRLDLTTAAGQRQDAPDRRFATHASKNEHPMPRWFRTSCSRGRPRTHSPGGRSVHAALPAVGGPRTLSIRRCLPESEVGRAVPRAPCRPEPRTPVLSHRSIATQSQGRIGRAPRERDPPYLDPDAFRLQGPSPGRPPGRSFAAAPGALMLFAPPALSPASLGPCPCGRLIADRHPRGPRTTCQRLQPNTTHEHTRDLPNLAHGKEDSTPSRGTDSIPPAAPEWDHAPFETCSLCGLSASRGKQPGTLSSPAPPGRAYPGPECVRVEAWDWPRGLSHRTPGTSCRLPG